MDLDKRALSPDGRHEAALEWAGDVRFGPAYYRLYVHGRRIPRRLFGAELVWSPDSRYLLVQEWLTTSERAGPHTRLVVLDLLEGRECALAEVRQGFVEPVGVEGSLVRFRESYYAPRKTIEREQDLPPADRWVKRRGLR